MNPLLLTHPRLMAVAVIAATILPLSGQNPGRNYVMVIEPDEGSAESPVADASVSRVTVDYYDGLGRPVQRVLKGRGGNGEDIVSMTGYDIYGKADRQWMPVGIAGGSGRYVRHEDYVRSAVSFYRDNRPYALTEYEQTALGRVTARYRPGAFFAGRIGTGYREEAYGTGDAGECRLFRCDLNGLGLVEDGYYGAKTLRVYRTVDEDGHERLEFIDRSGHRILDRRLDGSGIRHDTYYVYDMCDNLVHIIPPEAEHLFPRMGGSNDDLLERLCHSFRYDVFHRLTMLRRPGSEPEYYVYDKLDRVIFSQDGNQRLTGTWSVNKYTRDFHLAVEGYAVMEGATRETLQQQWGHRMLIESPSPASEAGLLYTDTCGISGFIPMKAYFYNDYSHWRWALPHDSGYPADTPRRPAVFLPAPRPSMAARAW